MLIMSKASQIRVRVKGIRRRVGKRRGVGFVVNAWPDRVVRRAKRVVGRAKVGKSFLVKR
jgi:hypothetical protein